jgi:hypothetical protein
MWIDCSHSAVLDGPRLDSRCWCHTPGVMVTLAFAGAGVLADAGVPAGVATAATATPSATIAKARAP